MIRRYFRLVVAVMLSLVLHGLPFVEPWPSARPAPPPVPPPLLAHLNAPPPVLQPPLSLPEPPRPKETRQAEPKASPALRPAPTAPRSWQEEIRQQLKRQSEQGLFYPAEAIAQGLEGEVIVFAIFDENGKVSAARVEQGSGYGILDQAALRAVRALHTRSADAPIETLLPIRFRLRQ